jgi:hypothetical protein
VGNEEGGRKKERMGKEVECMTIWRRKKECMKA